MVSKDLTRVEIIKGTCQCGTPFEYSIRYDRSGKPWGVHHELCSNCRIAKQKELSVRLANEKLPDEVEKQKEKWQFECQIPGFFIEKAGDGFEKFDRKLQPKAFDACKNFNGHSIILSSPELYGVGKTHLVSCLAFYLIEKTEAVSVTRDGYYRKYKCPVQFITETALLSKIRATYNRNNEDYQETEDDVYNKLSAYHVLIIDDVGKVRPKDYSFLQGVYFRIIDQRYTQEQVIILTTNLSLMDLEAHIGGACADRLKDMCGPGNIIKMTGKSYRGVK